MSDVLRLAGGREPRQIPASLCLAIITIGRAAGRLVPEVAGLVRRVELMWFGQAQAASSLDVEALPDGVAKVFQHEAGTR